MRLHRLVAALLTAGLLAACSYQAAPAVVQVSPASTPPETPEIVAFEIPDPPERDVYQLALELLPGVTEDLPRVAGRTTGELKKGLVEEFWLADLERLEVYKSQFELANVSKYAYWYVEAGEEVDRDGLEYSAAIFDQQIYPRITSVFGSEWSPGVDDDRRVTILSGAIRGAGGYFNSTDQYPRAVFKYSNQREMVYINAASIGVGTPGYLATLAHEFQHLVHWNQDASEDTWVNEGLSELASSVAGFRARNLQAYADGAPTSLINWPLDSARIGASYRTAALFMHYLSEHYGAKNGMRLLVETPEDGIEGVDEYLRKAGYEQTFRDVFRDWAVANYVDQPEGIYGYSDLEVSARPGKILGDYTEFRSEIPQYSVEYVELAGFEGPIRIGFNGVPTARIIPPEEVGSDGCWWSNSGDAIASTLTSNLDLQGMDRVALQYDVWYELEEDWDYAYVQISTDGGRHWRIINAPGTSQENPMGHGFGHGYTGSSKGWTTESVDLSLYAGKRVQVRFQYVTDDAVHGPGLCLRDLGVVEGELFRPVKDWEPNGFILTDNEVPQSYIVQVIVVETIEGTAEPTVTQMQLDRANTGSVEIDTPESLDNITVAVSALAPKTFQTAPYSLEVKAGE